MIRSIREESGRIDVLVNNAGITQDMAIFRMSEDQWRQVLETNLFGTFYCIKAAAFFMMKQQSGRIINISSLSSYFGAPGQANYAASKAGIVGLTRCLASELGPMNVTVNSVIPGLIPTDMTSKVPEDKMDTLTSRIPLKRTGTCAEVADLVGFLVSEKARYITGQVIAVDGGLSCQLGA
jgi:3-oxoacyl-[acyl-carrier protein] reductase